MDQLFQVAIQLDGNTVMTFLESGIAAQEVKRKLSIPYVIQTAGWHELTLVVDPDNVIAETSEQDNTYSTGQLRWLTAATPPPPPPSTATPIAPTLTSAPTPTATPQPALGRIAFSSDRDFNGEICVMNADGTDEQDKPHQQLWLR